MRSSASIDLTSADGISIQTALTSLSEVGTDVSKFVTPEHFASWLGLCPGNRVGGGRKLGVSTRPIANRLATALRMAAQSLYRTESALGDWFRRLRAKLGTPGASTATAHKLAASSGPWSSIGGPLTPRLGNPDQERPRRENSLRKHAKSLGFILQLLQTVPVS